MSEERKRILEMVKEGKLSTEEALVLLEKLEGDTPKTELLSTYVKDSKEQANDSNKQGSKKWKFTDFVESTLQKLKDADLDFNFGPSIEMKHIFQHKDVSLSSIEIDIANGDINLIPWDEKDIRVECEAKVYKVSNSESARKVFHNGVLFTVDGEQMRFSVQKKQIKVKTTFYVPQEDYHKISFRMFNGSITSEKLNADKLYAKTANGNLSFKNVKNDKIEVETANGHIHIDEANAKEIEVETLNGTISVEGSFYKIDLQSFNGSIICKNHYEKSHSILLKSKAGNIDVFVPKDLEVDGKLKSNIGGFTYEIDNIMNVEEKKELVQKELRFVANKGNEQAIYIDAESNAGSILIKHL